MVAEDYKPKTKGYDMGMDAVVIRQYLGGITGGRALNYANFKDEVIQAGHMIVRKKVDDVYEYSPLETEGGKYKDKTSDAEFAETQWLFSLCSAFLSFLLPPRTQEPRRHCLRGCFRKCGYGGR